MKRIRTISDAVEIISAKQSNNDETNGIFHCTLNARLLYKRLRSTHMDAIERSHDIAEVNEAEFIGTLQNQMIDVAVDMLLTAAQIAALFGVDAHTLLLRAANKVQRGG